MNVGGSEQCQPHQCPKRLQRLWAEHRQTVSLVLQRALCQPVSEVLIHSHSPWQHQIRQLGPHAILSSLFIKFWKH